MGILKDSDKAAVRKQLETLTGNVKIINFTQELECQFCRETNQLVREVAELSDKLSAETFNFVNDRQVAEQYKIDKIPATIVMGEEDFGIRFYGIPSGYEFSTFLEAIGMVSSGQSGLLPASRETLRKVEKPLHIQVFVTPT